MAGQADGSIIIDTTLDSQGFKAGSAELQWAVKSLVNKVNSLGPAFQKALSGGGNAVNSFNARTQALETTIAELKAKLSEMGTQAFPTDQYTSISQAIEQAGYKLEALLAKQKELKALGVSENSQQWQRLQYQIERTGAQCDTYAAKLHEMEDSGTASVIGTQTAEYQRLSAALAEATDKLAAMNSEANKSHGSFGGFLKGAASNLAAGIKAAASNLAARIKAAASNMARMVFHGRSLNGQFSGLISSAKKFTLSLLGARGVYTLLRKAVSAYMAQNQQLASTLSSCWSGIGNLLGPIITKLINLVAQAVAYVTTFLKLFGILSGEAQSAISGAGGAAADAAKDLKRQLASFDDLNILNDNSSDSGGGGGSAGNTGAELPDVTLPDWAKLMVEQIKAGDWAAAATTLAEQLNKMVASVDWAGIGQKIGYYLNGALTFIATFIKKFDWKAVGSDLATLLNNAITSVDWGNLGVILTAKLAILMQFLTGFFETFDGKAFGDGIYDFIMGGINAVDWAKCTGNLSKAISDFITAIDFGKIGQALSKRFRTVLQSINASIENFDWESLGEQIADFINGIDWEGIINDLATLIGKLIGSILDLIIGFAKNLEWSKLGKEIGSSLAVAIDKIDWSGIGTAISDILIGAFNMAFALVAEIDFGKLLQDILDGIGDCIAHLDVGSILGGILALLISIVAQLPGMIVGLLGGIFDLIGALFEALGLDSVAGFFYGIGEALSDARQWLKDNFVDPIVGWVKDLFEIHSPSKVFAEIGGFLIDGLLQGIKNAWQPIVGFFTSALYGLKNRISGAWGSIKSTTSNMWNGIKSGLSSAWNGIKSTASSTWNNLKSTISSGWNNIKSTTSSVWNSVKSSLSSTWSNVKSTASSTWNNLKSTVSSGWNNVKSTTSSIWNNVKSSLSSTWNSIKSTASSTWSGIKSTIQNQGWYDIGGNICKGISNGIESGWNWLKNKVSSLASNLLSAAKSALGIHSPSRLFRDEIGLNIGYGIGEGVEDSEPSILKTVSGVADAIAEEMNSNTYTIGQIGVDAEGNITRRLTGFSDTITNSFTSLLDRLQAIAERVTFTVPNITYGATPYHVSAAVGSSGPAGSFSDAIEASNDELISAIAQAFATQTAALVSAMESNRPSIKIDKSSMAEAVIQEINRRTRMANKSPLMG